MRKSTKAMIGLIGGIAILLPTAEIVSAAPVPNPDPCASQTGDAYSKCRFDRLESEIPVATVTATVTKPPVTVTATTTAPPATVTTTAAPITTTAAATTTAPITTTATTTPAAPAGTLFADEFSGASGSLPDSAKWGYEVGGNIRNGELQYYTNARPENASMDGSGNLQITVRKESYSGSAYTSAMIWTQNKYTFLTGCIEARIKTPIGSGLWPAFWTEGSTGSWPTHGEIDMMEEINSDQWTTTNIHGGPSDWSDYEGHAANRSAWHVYKSCITNSAVTWYFDGALKHTFTKAQMPAGQTWPFGTVPQFIRLNVAMGGSFPGTPNGSAVLPATMLVDYVHVTSS